MSAVLICADSVRSADMRQAVPVAVPDPFLDVERNGTRTAVVTAFEAPRIPPPPPASTRFRPSGSASTSCSPPG